MLDTAPFLSMVDDSELEISSISNATSVTSNRLSSAATAARRPMADLNRLDKLEREMASLSTRFEQESQARKKLQEILLQAGVTLPPEISLVQ